MHTIAFYSLIHHPFWYLFCFSTFSGLIGLFIFIIINLCLKRISYSYQEGNKKMVDIVYILGTILGFIIFFIIFGSLIYITRGLKREHRVVLTICGIIMMCNLPFTWAISFGSSPFHSLFFYGFLIALIGFFIVMILYSTFLAIGLQFLNIGLIETIEQTILSQTYPSLSFSLLSWNIYLVIGVLSSLVAIPERIFRSKEENN